MKRLISAAIFVAMVCVGTFLYWSYQWLQKPLDIDENGFEHVLVPGDSLARFAYQLNRKGILEHPRILLAYARLIGATEVKAGEYFFEAGSTPLAMLAKLERGDVVTYQVTLVEGWTFSQALKALHDQPKLTASLSGKSRAEQLVLLGLDVEHPEGWFFPDTYKYTAGNTDVDILQRAYQRMQDVLNNEWRQRGEDLPYSDPYQALIMASIVERETGLPSERKQIAGVFVRRLKMNMRLQTDPSVIYGLGDAFDGNIRRRHLKQATPYNTYVVRGLPPTPIALPGREAIVAALHPDQGSALYFVARGDGSHHFSSTLEEHNQAVNRYQILRRNRDYRSSPQPAEQEKPGAPKTPSSQTAEESQAAEQSAEERGAL